jgi:hypothetical protein
MSTTNYEQVKYQINDGDVIFFQSNTLIGKLIGLVSKYSHVGIAFWVTINNTKRLMIVEAKGLNYRRIVNLSYWSNSNMVVVSTNVKWSDIADAALAKVGEEQYGYFDFIWIGIREAVWKLLRIRLPKIAFPGEVCSEFVARIMSVSDTNVSPEVLIEQLQEEKQGIVKLTIN